MKPIRKQIEITLNSGKKKSVPAVVFGPIAAWEGIGGWSVTHVPTGLLIHPRAGDLEQEDAKRLVKRLLRMKVDWADLAAVKRARKEIVEACVAVWRS